MSLDTPLDTPPYEQDRLRIDVWSDVVCPACYLADHRLRQAIAASPAADRVDVVVHAFELHPDTPDEIDDNSAVLARMTGSSVAEVEATEARLAEVAEAEGLPFSVRRTHRRTESVHRLVKLADEHRPGAGAELLADVQRRVFRGDADAFEHDTLVAAAEAQGVPTERARAILAGDDYRDEVARDRREAVGLGARGVPFVVLDGRFAVSGASTVAGYAAAIERALAPGADRFASPPPARAAHPSSTSTPTAPPATPTAGATGRPAAPLPDPGRPRRTHPPRKDHP